MYILLADSYARTSDQDLLPARGALFTPISHRDSSGIPIVFAGVLMELMYEDLEDGVRAIRLKGRLDLEGADAIDLKLTSLAAVRQGSVVLDLALVEFLASIGVSVIVRTAKALSSRGGRLVLLSPRPNIADVLTRTQIDQIIPVFYDLAAARAAALAQS
jgi:anti-anti-sigma factor